MLQDIPIVKHTNRETGEVVDNCVFCADILDVLTQNFFAQKGKHVEEKPHVEDVKVCCLVFSPTMLSISSCRLFLHHLLRLKHHNCVNLSYAAGTVLREVLLAEPISSG